MTLTPRFEAALALAAWLHADQRRKGTEIPYLAHLLAVAAIALEHGADEDEAIAALLHDAVEDQGGAEVLERIRRRFGDRVALIVLGCSDATQTPKPPWRERKETYLAHVAAASPSVRLVSAADKLHNARAILTDHRLGGETVWDRFNGGRDGTLWYYRELVTAFRAAEDRAARSDRPALAALIDELDGVVLELERRSREPGGV